ncbi:Protein of unknown function [Lentibacillus persicus]|uniref:DUF1510 domain-containing protein n=1 Tax=Lentibacillus persicus TaxID=640948 RepID=A0A1I1TD86_9BACI|nr:YrrS family protein [Lentibacillus persicus]SFD56549.1 Protein of unknown function [Lentibacillus persicus]
MPASRLNKYEKRRKNTKLISILSATGSVLAIVLLGLIIFGGSDEASETKDPLPENESVTKTEENENTAVNKSDTTENSLAKETNIENDSEMNGDVNLEQTEPSDDNVSEAYTGNWQAVGTEQTEPHTVNYSEGSQDRQEMRKAVAAATGLDEERFIMWWIKRNGDQRVINTVSSSDESELYRVYNTWVPDEGWQPTKVEKLKENDQKWRFE